MKTFNAIVVVSFVILTALVLLNAVVATVAFARTADPAAIRLVATAGSNYVIALLLMAGAGTIWRKSRAASNSPTA